jgi:acyl-CoA thioesterase II
MSVAADQSAAGSEPARPVSLSELLTLDEVRPGRFRSEVSHGGSTSLFGTTATLYGGQLVALSLAAAARTTAAGRLPLQVNCAFLRGGRPDAPIEYAVQLVRDGRSFAQRIVEAHQGDRHLCTMTASFHAGARQPSLQDVEFPDPAAADTLPPMPVDHLFGVEARLPGQPRNGPWPTRYWARAVPPVPDIPAADACVLAYLSDTCTPLFPTAHGHHGPTVSHTIWFHQRVDASQWMLVDLVRRTVAGGIGQYIGSVFDPSGVLVATLAQEAVFRSRE